VSARKNTDTILNGVTIGAVVLAVLVLFAVFLPKAQASTPSLPDALPGGLVAADLDSAWSSISNDLLDSAKQQGYTDDQIQQSLDQYKQQLESDRSSIDQAFAKASDVKSVSRMYIDDQLDTYGVQAFRARNAFIAPTPFEGGSADIKVIDGVTCVLTTSTSSDGTSQTTGTECQVSDGDFTVQVTSADDAAKVAKVANAALDSLHH
jgi:hypothetical protein